MSDLINDEAVYRTAPATPGLLNISNVIISKDADDRTAKASPDLLMVYCSLYKVIFGIITIWIIAYFRLYYYVFITICM